MGTHPIFESDFDCLTEMASKEPSELDLVLNAQLIHKGHSSYPAPQRKPDQYEQVASQMSDKQISEMKIINRGHLGIPEEILKAGAAQYASMCSNINNKFMLCKQETHGDPRACLKVGAAVSDCASEYFTAAINRCGEELYSYSQCLETDSFRRPSFCRGAQAAWDHCAFAKLGIDKSYWTSTPAPVAQGDLPSKPKNPLNLKPSVANNDPMNTRFNL